MKWFFKALEKYAVFKGRARRKEYWMFILFYFIFFIAFTFLDAILGTYNQVTIFSLFNRLYLLLTVIPLFAVTVRRLHDVGNSGWLLLFIIIPFAYFWVLYLTLKKGDVGINKFGAPRRKAIEIEKKILDFTGKTKIERQCPNCYKTIIITPYGENKNVIVTDDDLEKNIVRCRVCRKKIDLKSWVVIEREEDSHNEIK